MAIKEGERLPAGTLTEMTESGPKQVSTDELFKGKRLALFAVPGAFTPTCSAKHLPGFVQSAAALKAKGIDAIACVSVNDAFVMGAWGKDQHVGDKVRMLADGNAAWTKALGLELDASGYGMGTRSRRYSMIVENGVVKKLNLEDGGAYKVSDADTMLKQL